ncbi:MAG: NAD(P)H-dependent oxidoreductase subunit E [Gemmatimonadetes bacterium]|nr:NAD(P)H-dependent oxidoreductase subunit E [Gemmatimonadota bacterium]
MTPVPRRREAFTLSDERLERADRIIARYPGKLAAILPILWLVTEEKGWISPEAMEWVAAKLDCSPAKVQAVVTFYTMFDDHPVGKYKLQVCRTLSCELMGARRIVDHLRERLGIELGQTTGDGMFTLQEVECLASCGTAPMMQCNLKFYEHLTPDRVDALLDELESREPEWEDVEPVIWDRPSDDAYRAMFPESGKALRRERTGGAEVEEL